LFVEREQQRFLLPPQLRPATLAPFTHGATTRDARHLEVIVTRQTGQPHPIDHRLGAYLAAVGASFAVAQPAEAAVVSFAGPWTGTGTGVTLLSFNLAGDVQTNGDPVGNEQFFFSHTAGTIPAIPMTADGGQTPVVLDTSILSLQARGAAGVLLVPGNQGSGLYPFPATYGGNPFFVTPTGLQISGPNGTKSAPLAFASGGDLLAAVRNNNAFPVLPGTGALPPTKGAIPIPPGKIPPSKVPNGGVIQPGEGWVDGGFRPGTQGFLMLRFDGPGDALFPGWAEILVNDVNALTLLAYGYEDTGAPIAVGDRGNVQPPPTPAPEPGTLALLALGATGLAVLRRRRAAEAARVARADA
jgi:hypothetical protein